MAKRRQRSDAMQPAVIAKARNKERYLKPILVCLFFGLSSLALFFERPCIEEIVNFEGLEKRTSLEFPFCAT